MIAMLSVALALLYTFTTQVSAQAPPQAPDMFNVSLGTQKFFYNQLLDFSFSGPISSCTDNCASVKSILAGTNGDAQQLCKNETVQSLLECEQCMFTALIKNNKPMPDLRAGSTPLLQSYATSCTERAKVTFPPKNISLAVPPTFDGPMDIFVPTVGLVFTVGTATFLATSSIILLSNM
ncbi:hypothetical protein E1B28_010093 [Marasmius oreades]|uniref:Transmembrane protein n=1 Tax=Marasmius oreades TaxID=181124 RepID=A0A9P7RWJ3_9AGAR|nr:uncharacterized protein E1B28_010093 [Marasmius oreades]KAG7091032.1 hypothetical protein E1B28_010093 [Marasmius oreades]